MCSSKSLEFSACQQQLFESLTCCICLNIPHDSVITSCDHIFCRICLATWLQNKKVCPLDMREIDASNVVSLKIREPFFFKTMYSVLQIMCPNKCEWVGYIGSVNAHTSKYCKRATISCAFECDVKNLERGQVQEHFDEVHCKEFIASNTMNFRQLLGLQHLDHCPTRLLKIVAKSISSNVLQFMDDAFRLKPIIDKLQIELRVFMLLKNDLFARKCNHEDYCPSLETHFYTNVICALFSKQHEMQWQQLLKDGVTFCNKDPTLKVASMVVFNRKLWEGKASLVTNKILVSKCFTKQIDACKTECKQKFPKRQPTFDMSQGKAEISITFPKGEQSLIVSSLQMIVLLMFDSKDVLSAQEISDKLFATTLYSPRVWLVVSDHLMSLCHPKSHILHKKPYTKELRMTDLFELNEHFTLQPGVTLEVPVLICRLANQHSLRSTLRSIVSARIVCKVSSQKNIPKVALFEHVLQDIKPHLQDKETFTMTHLEEQLQGLISQEYMVENADGTISAV